MRTIIPFGSSVVTNVIELIKLSRITHISVISVKSDILLVTGNTEFYKFYSIRGAGPSGSRQVNYQLPVEVMKLLTFSRKVNLKQYNDDIFLIMEETVTPDAKETQLFVYLDKLSPEEHGRLKMSNRPEPTLIADLRARKHMDEAFVVPISIEYDLPTRIGWYLAYLSPTVPKYAMEVGDCFKQMTEVSKIFKSGICIQGGLAYVDSMSKAGVELYRSIAYSGEPMLVSNECMTAMADFARNAKSSLRLFKYKEYMLAGTTYGLALIWRNLRFTVESNIDDLRSLKYLAVYETDSENLKKIFSSIKYTKANKIDCNLDFNRDLLTIRDASKGEYTFFVPFDCIRGDYPDNASSVRLNFAMMRSLFSVALNYNKVRIYIYASLIRIDFVNIYEDVETEELIVDGDNKTTIVFGKSE